MSAWKHPPQPHRQPQRLHPVHMILAATCIAMMASVGAVVLMKGGQHHAANMLDETHFCGAC